MNTKDISSGMSYNEVKNMFSQVIEMLEDLDNKQPSTIEVDLTPITEKLNQIINRPEMRDFTAEQKRYLFDKFESQYVKIRSIVPDDSKLNEIVAMLTQLSVADQTKTVIYDHRYKFGFGDTRTIILVLFMFVAIVILSSSTYFLSRPNYDSIDNDLKYRYIKMKGEATPQRIADMENIFEINRNQAIINQIKKDVTNYEQAVMKKAALDEQTRLGLLEAERLKREAERLRK